MKTFLQKHVYDMITVNCLKTKEKVKDFEKEFKARITVCAHHWL